MISKADVKWIRQLKQKKFRQKHNAFVVEGEKLITELLQSDFKVLKGFSVGAHFDFQDITERELKSISQLTAPNRHLAVVEQPLPQSNVKGLGNQMVLALDGVKDPGNLGTIIRIADWFGIQDLFCSEETVDAYNAKVVQASMGSIFRVRVHHLNLVSFLENYKKHFPEKPIYAADIEGENAFESKLEPGLLILGSESHGLNKEVLQQAKRITIPKFGHAESLNVAVATGILCSQFSKVNPQN
mgnify:FL=1